MKDQQNKIRFGIISNGYQFLAWQVEAIRNLLAEVDVDLAVLIMIPEKETPPQEDEFLWKSFYRYYVTRKAKALQLKDLANELKAISIVECTTSQTDLTNEIFDPKDVETIKNYDLDFILNFKRDDLKGEILETAKFGVWSYHHSNYGKNATCFWEIFNEELVTQALLKRYSNKSNEIIILKTGFLKTELFYPKNIDNIHFESAKWPAKLCVDIRNEQYDNLSTPSVKSPVKKTGAPSSIQLILFFWVQFKILLKKAYKTLFITDYWNIGVAAAPIEAFLNPKNLPKVTWFPKLPKNKFIADPFGFYHKDQLHIIYEDFLFKERFGTTAALTFNNETFNDNGIVIKEDFHMSYPFTFEDNGSIYCIPETYQSNQVRLYKAIDFPKKWKLDRILIDHYAGIDNTLLKTDGYWWLFSTDKLGGHNCNLNIHFSKELFGPWHPHPKNPVKTDVRSARPAGTIFSKNNQLFRPSMDYSKKVEGRIVINKILKLSKTDFKEEAYCTIDPYTDTYFSDKIHTLSEAGNYTIIDGAKELFVLTNMYAFRYKLISLMKKLSKK